MPVRISDLSKGTGEIKIEVPEDMGGGELNVVYRPGKYTPAVEEKSRAFGQSSEAWASLLGNGLLVSWDLVDEGGNIYRVDEVGLRELPGLFLQLVGTEVGKAMSPNRTSGGNSVGSF